MSVPVDLRVPPSAVPILRKFAELTDEQGAKIIKALEEIPLTISTNDLSVSVDKALPNFTEAESDTFIGVIFSLLSISISHNWRISDVAQGVAEYREIGIPGDSQTNFALRLSAALSVPAIADIANAADVATEYDSLYHVARCLTDIRPVFTGSTEPKLSGGVIVHNLKFDYSANGEIESFTVALTDKDVQELRRVLADATDKSRELQTFLEASNLRVFKFGEASEGD